MSNENEGLRIMWVIRWSVACAVLLVVAAMISA